MKKKKDTYAFLNKVKQPAKRELINLDAWSKHVSKLRVSLLDQVFTPHGQDEKEVKRAAREAKKADWKRYYNLVWSITKEQQLSALEGFEQREFRMVEIDHMVSVWEGWKYGFPAQWIGSLSNLRIVEGWENRGKGRRSLPGKLEEMIKRKLVNDIYRDRVLD